MGSKRLNTESFIQKAQAKHGVGKYDYSQAVFAHTKQRIIIICPRHGEFNQVAGTHLAGHGCLECGKATAKATVKFPHYTTEQFIQSARAKHGAVYDYSLVAYTRAIDEIKIICPTHSVFEQLPYSHLRGAGCPRCVGIRIAEKNVGFTPEAFIARCQKLHPALDLSQTRYINRRLMVSVVCLQHGKMDILPSTLLRGHGCPKCTWAGFAGKATGWTRSRWVLHQRGRPAVLYVFRLQGEGELFYKVGITYQPKQRIAQLPYCTGIVQLFQSNDAANIYNLERTIKAKFKHLRYKPQKYFAGQQECYNSFSEIVSYLQDFSAT